MIIVLLSFYFLPESIFVICIFIKILHFIQVFKFIGTGLLIGGTYFFNLYIYLLVFWLHWVFAAAPRLSLVAASGALVSSCRAGLLAVVASLVASTGSGLVVHGLRCPQHVGSSQTRG